MTTDVRDAATAATPMERVRRHRRRGQLLVVAGLFNVWLWITRTINLVGDDVERTAAFVAVHAVLYATAFLVAVVVGVIGAKMWREGRATQQPGDRDPRDVQGRPGDRTRRDVQGPGDRDPRDG